MDETQLLALYRKLTPDWQRHLLAYAKNVLDYCQAIAKLNSTLSAPIPLPIGDDDDSR